MIQNGSKSAGANVFSVPGILMEKIHSELAKNNMKNLISCLQRQGSKNIN